MKWISIENDLPDKGIKVLLYCKPIGITTGYYWGKGAKNEPSDPCNGWCLMGVTHWMPLVEPPEGFKDVIQK
jgi:hypothetical protein